MDDKVNIQPKHVLSVEIEPFKREFLMAAHTNPGEDCPFHVFADVKVFEDGKGFCYSCQTEHDANIPLDVLFAGPSCKNVSKEFIEKRQYAQCHLHVQKQVYR